ncbi:hypothetical protein [Shimia sediminis]|uniref:hypothetical protein n=1 Tax=Shimia sediminis TaxID=2497945 RepID=UPI000F8D5BCD|nr:hypothetical protein [Shimia sediminis]
MTREEREQRVFELLRSRGLEVEAPISEIVEKKGKKLYNRGVSYEFVKDDPEFQKVASENQWRERTARGLPSRMCIFKFLKDTYEPWFGGMNQADLKVVDPSAWRALQNRLQKDEMPAWLRLPKLSDRYLPKPGTPEYEAVQQARRQNRERMRLLRSLQPN